MYCFGIDVQGGTVVCDGYFVANSGCLVVILCFSSFVGFLMLASPSIKQWLVVGLINDYGGNVEILWEGVELLDVVVRCPC